MSTIIIVAAAQTVANALKQIDFDNYYVKSMQISQQRFLLFLSGPGATGMIPPPIEILCMCKLPGYDKFIGIALQNSMTWKYAYDYLKNAPDVPIEIEINENNSIRIIHCIS